MDSLKKQIEAISLNLDNFPVGAAKVHDSISPESEVNKVHSNIQCTNADILFLQALIEVAKIAEVTGVKTDDTHIAKYENDLVNLMSVARMPQNMADLADEIATFREALEMQPEAMKHKSPSLGSILEHMHNILLKCSSSQLEILELQSDINNKIRDIQVMESALMKKKSKFASNLSKQYEELYKKDTSKDRGYDRKNKGVKSIAQNVNNMKMIIQGLINLSPDTLTDKRMVDILVYTRKPVNLLTFSTQL